MVMVCTKMSHLTYLVFGSGDASAWRLRVKQSLKESFQAEVEV